MGQLYTIGHSTFPEEHLTELLQSFQVDYLLDVRSVPFSQYVPQYNDNQIMHTLDRVGIQYAQMGRFFGARQEDEAYYNKEGYLDFELFRSSELFRAGLENVKKGLQEHNIALMCAEKNPIDCHRAIMVARGFELNGVDVKHILHDFTFLPQESLNRQLLNRYFPDRDQISLFDADNRPEEELVRSVIDAGQIEKGEPHEALYHWFYPKKCEDIFRAP